MDLEQYTIPKAALDLENLLDDWRWLLPENYTVLLINRFAEFLIEDLSGIIYHFEPGTGTLREIAKDQDELKEVFNDDGQLSDFLMVECFRKSAKRFSDEKRDKPRNWGVEVIKRKTATP